MATQYANAPGRVFNEAFNAIEEVLEFNPKWANDTGYLDNAVDGEDAPRLEEGEVAKFIDGYGRRAIIIGTFYGNVVVFDRYKGQEDGGVYVTNTPSRTALIETIIPNGAVSEITMINILGGWGNLDDNVGNTIKMAHLQYEKAKAQRQ